MLLTIVAHICLLVVITIQNLKKSCLARRAKQKQQAQIVKTKRRKNLINIRNEMIKKRQELVVEDITPQPARIIQVENVD